MTGVASVLSSGLGRVVMSVHVAHGVGVLPLPLNGAEFWSAPVLVGWRLLVRDHPHSPSVKSCVGGHEPRERSHRSNEREREHAEDEQICSSRRGDGRPEVLAMGK